MASYQLTEAAQEDLDEIYEYSILTFGLRQARDYLRGLHTSLNTLAENPRMGRDFSHVKEAARRFEYVSHSVYYRVTDDGILVLRVLHMRMDPGLHL